MREVIDIRLLKPVHEGFDVSYRKGARVKAYIGVDGHAVIVPVRYIRLPPKDYELIVRDGDLSKLLDEGA